MNTFTNFKDMGAAMGVKMPKAKAEPARKCENCGAPMRKVVGTNIWVCDFHKMTDEKLPNGTSVQVFSECGNTSIG